jgi:hypothetical protein
MMSHDLRIRRAALAVALALIALSLLWALGAFGRAGVYPGFSGAVFAEDVPAGEVEIDLGGGFARVAQASLAPASAPVEIDAPACPVDMDIAAHGQSARPLALFPTEGEPRAVLVDVPPGVPAIDMTTADRSVTISRPSPEGPAVLLLEDKPGGGCTARWAVARFDIDRGQALLRRAVTLGFPLHPAASGKATAARLAHWPVATDAGAKWAGPAVETADRVAFPLTLEPGPASTFTWTARLIAAGGLSVLAGLFAHWVVCFARSRSRGEAASRQPIGRAAVLAGIGASAYLLFWLAASWPGRVGWDVSVTIEAHAWTDHHGWFGWFFPALLSASLELGSIAWLTVLTWGLHLAVVWLVVLYFGRERRGLVACVALLAGVVLTAIAPSSTYLLRDTLNGVVLALVALLAFRLCARSSAWASDLDPFYVSAFTVLVASVVLLRTDNIVFLLPLLPLFLWRGPGALPVRVGSVTLALALAFAFPVAAKRALSPRPLSELKIIAHHYGTSAYINGAGAVIASPGFDHWRHAEALAAVHRIIDYGLIQRDWRPDNVHYWHVYLRPPALKKKDVRRMRDAWVQLAMAYPAQFLEGRFLTFAGTMGGLPGVPLTVTKLEDRTHLNDHPGRAERYGFTPASPLRSSADWILYPLMRFWSSWPGLLIAMGIAVAAILGRAWVSSAIALAALARAGAFFLFEPLTIFYYLYELQFMTFLLPLMLIAERRKKPALRARAARLLPSGIRRMGGRRAAIAIASLMLIGAALLAFQTGGQALVGAGPDADSPADRDGKALVDFLNAVERRVATLSEAGCRAEEIDFQNDVYIDNRGALLNPPERFEDSSERCRVFEAGTLEPLVAPPSIQIAAAPHEGDVRTGSVAFGFRAIPGVGSAASDLVAIVAHVDPLACAYTARPEAGPGATGRIHYMDGVASQTGASAEPAPQLSDAVRGLRQFCVRSTAFEGVEGERHTHLVRLLLAR